MGAMIADRSARLLTKIAALKQATNARFEGVIFHQGPTWLSFPGTRGGPLARAAQVRER